MELRRLLAEHSVGEVVHGVCRLGSHEVVVDGDGHGDLLSPQRHRVDDAGLELHRHILVVLLDHADLRSGLQTACPRQTEVVHLLLKLVDGLGKVVRLHRVLGQSRSLRSGVKLGKLAALCLFDRKLSRLDVHGQRLEGVPVLIIERVEHRDILLQVELVTLELLLDAVERLFDALVAGANGYGVFLDLFEEA